METQILNNLFLITFITVNIIDISGITNHIEEAIQRWLKLPNIPHIHLMECSYCVNWWLSLLYLIITNNFTLEYVSFVLLLSLLTPVINDLILNVKDLLVMLVNLPLKWFRKIK